MLIFYMALLLVFSNPGSISLNVSFSSQAFLESWSVVVKSCILALATSFLYAEKIQVPSQRNSIGGYDRKSAKRQYFVERNVAEMLCEKRKFMYR